MTRLAMFVLLVLTQGIASAQFARLAEHEQRVETVRHQLQSSDPREVAWGAFTAASYQLREVGSDLAAALDRPPSGGDQSAVISALLDAAVQTRALIRCKVFLHSGTQRADATLFSCDGCLRRRATSGSQRRTSR